MATDKGLVGGAADIVGGATDSLRETTTGLRGGECEKLNSAGGPVGNLTGL